MKKIRSFLLAGLNGKITGFLSQSSKNQVPHIGPLIESQTFSTPDFSFFLPARALNHEASHLKKRFGDWYKSIKKYGPFGDALKVSRVQINGSVLYKLDTYGQLAFPKPGIAADVAIFLRSSNGKVLLVGILRKEPPAKGKLALIGGFRDINGLHLQSGIETAIAEVKQEIGVTLEPDRRYERIITAEPYYHSVPVTVTFYRSSLRYKSEFSLLGSFYSSDTEKVNGSKMKRVYETVAYGLMIDIGNLSARDLSAYFRAQDDAKEVILRNINRVHFPLAHHEKIFQAARQKFHV